MARFILTLGYDLKVIKANSFATRVLISGHASSGVLVRKSGIPYSRNILVSYISMSKSLNMFSGSETAE